MVNRVILVGRLTRDPEIVVSPKGLTIAKLRLATNGYSKDDNGNRQDDVQYHSLVAFDRLAAICQEFLTRGKLIYVEGRLRSHEWDGKDGLRRYTTEVVLDQMKMLGPKPEGAASEPLKLRQSPCRQPEEKADDPRTQSLRPGRSELRRPGRWTAGHPARSRLPKRHDRPARPARVLTFRGGFGRRRRAPAATGLEAV